MLEIVERKEIQYGNHRVLHSDAEELSRRTAMMMMIISVHRFEAKGGTTIRATAAAAMMMMMMLVVVVLLVVTTTRAKTVRTKTATGTGLVDKTLLDARFHSFLVLPAVFFVELCGHRVGWRVWIWIAQ